MRKMRVVIAKPGSRRSRPRRQGHRPRAARRRHGSDLHGPAADARADRRRRAAGGRRRHRPVDPERRAHAHLPAADGAAAREGAGPRARARRRHHSGRRHPEAARRWASRASSCRAARCRTSSTSSTSACSRAPRRSDGPMPKTLLLADDSVTIQRVIELTFAHEDVRVVSVGDGEQRRASASTASGRTSCWPTSACREVDGYDVVAHVKKSPRCGTCPCCCWPARSSRSTRTRARRAGATASSSSRSSRSSSWRA